jgi:FMN phosphatase YigB (HAD superfamily)
MKYEKERKIKIIFFDADGVLFDTAGYTENNRKIALSTWNVVFHELDPDDLIVVGEHI